MNTPRLRDLIASLQKYRSGVVCDGADQTIARLAEVCPGAVIHEFPSGQEVNGWIVPQAWEVQHATWRSTGATKTLDGERPTLSYDALKQPHNLGVAQYSQPFQGTVRGDELKRHLFYSEAFPEAAIYHCDWWYKPHIKDWGFCVPKTLYDQVIDNGLYQVDLRTTFKPGTMKVLEWVLPGSSPDSIILNAHTCHPGLANDDLAGCVVGIEVMRRLAKVENRRYTYRLILAPEHYGSIFYIQSHRYPMIELNQITKMSDHISGVHYALFLESLGSSGPLALQESFTGKSRIDHALSQSLPQSGNQCLFRELVGNDETCWDAAGIEIPCPSLSRVPFKEYHTSLDTVDIIHEDKLQEAATVVTRALLMLDRDVTMQRQFTGLVCLSNPKYDLYQPYFDPSIPDRRTITAEAKNWNRLMNHLPRYFDGRTTCIDLAERFGIPFEAIRAYVGKWADKGLITLAMAGESGDPR